jgi:hypothetical protein
MVLGLLVWHNMDGVKRRVSSLSGYVRGGLVEALKVWRVGVL